MNRNRRAATFLVALLAFLPPAHAQSTKLSDLLSAIRAKSKSLESNSATRHDYESFLAPNLLDQTAPRYSDYILVPRLFEAPRDAGYWGMHWSITDQPPNSDRIWQQWKSAAHSSFPQQPATAECDELSALFA